MLDWIFAGSGVRLLYFKVSLSGLLLEATNQLKAGGLNPESGAHWASYTMGFPNWEAICALRILGRKAGVPEFELNGFEFEKASGTLSENSLLMPLWVKCFHFLKHLKQFS